MALVANALMEAWSDPLWLVRGLRVLSPHRAGMLVSIMAGRRHHAPEQIVRKLREAECASGEGTVLMVCKSWISPSRSTTAGVTSTGVEGRGRQAAA